MRNQIILLIWILALFSTSAHSKQCDVNLAVNLGLPKDQLFENSQATSNLKYCSSISNTCCEPELINKFQDLIDDKVNEFAKNATHRDQGFNEIIKTRDEVIKNFTVVIDKAAEVLGVAGQTLYPLNSLIQKAVKSDQEYGRGFPDRWSAFVDQAKSNIAGYQSERKKCWDTLVSIKASALCLACDADRPSGIVDNTSITYGQDLLQTLDDSCQEFINIGSTIDSVYALNEFPKYSYNVSLALVQLEAQYKDWDNLPQNNKTQLQQLFNYIMVFMNKVRSDPLGIIRQATAEYNPEYFVGLYTDKGPCVLSKDAIIPWYFAQAGSYNGLFFPNSCNQQENGWNPDFKSSGISVDVPTDPQEEYVIIDGEDETIHLRDDYCKVSAGRLMLSIVSMISIVVLMIFG